MTSIANNETGAIEMHSLLIASIKGPTKSLQLLIDIIINYWFGLLMKIYLTKRWEVLPREAVQWMPGVVKVAEPLPGLVRIRHLLWVRVNLEEISIKLINFKVISLICNNIIVEATKLTHTSLGHRPPEWCGSHWSHRSQCPHRCKNKLNFGSPHWHPAHTKDHDESH